MTLVWNRLLLRTRTYVKHALTVPYDEVLFMPSIYLSNFDLIRYWLKYDTDTGTHEIIPYQQKSRIALSGSYVVVGSETIGYHVSPKGPVLFCNERRFRIFDRTYTGEIEKDKAKGLNIFRLLQDNQKVLSISYKPPPPITWGLALMAEEDTDFFMRLAGDLAKPRFYAEYTRDSPFPLPPNFLWGEQP